MAVGALVQKPLTSLMSLGKARPRAGPARQARRHRRDPVPVRLPRDDPRTAGVDPAPSKETNVGFNLVPAMLSSKVDATLGAFWNYEGVDLRAPRRKPGDPAHGAPRRADLRRARLRRRAKTSTSAALEVRGFLQATARGPRGAARRSRRGADALLKADPGPRPRPPAGRRRGDAAGLLPRRRRPAVRLAGPSRVERLRRWMPTRGCSGSRRRRAGADERVPAGRGARRRGARPSRTP